MATRICPLHSSRLESLNWGRSTFEELEIHVKSSTITCCHPPLKDLVLTGFLEGSTPLLMACQKGDFESVHRIVHFWEADVNRAAVFYMPHTGFKLENVTPLYVAAKYRHSEIVRYLVEEGANVSAKTERGDTPLYAAIVRDVLRDVLPRDDEEQLAIIRMLLEGGADPSARPDHRRPVWLDPSCCLEILELLVRSGLDLNQRCPVTCDTVLHLWASRYFAKHCGTGYEGKSLTVVQFLVGNGADLHARNNIGFTPIFCAAVGDANPASGRYQMLYLTCKTPPNFSVFEFLLEKHNIRRMDKIYALELAGAFILGNDDYDLKLGFEYWRRALALRLLNTNGCCPIHKKTSSVSNHPRIIEWSTLEELQQIEEDPSQWEMQKMLTKFRILSNISWKAARRFVWGHVDTFSNFSLPAHRIVPALSLILAVLEKVHHFHPDEIRSSVLTMVELLHCILFSPNSNILDLGSEILKTTIDLIATKWTLANLKVVFQNTDMITLNNFIGLICLPRFREHFNEAILDALSEFVRRDIRDGDGCNLFHWACTPQFSDNDYFENVLIPLVPTYSSPLARIQLLLQLGMGAKVFNNNRDTPLHILVDDYEKEGNDEAAHLLLTACGERCDHCDPVNNEGKTATEVLMMKRKQQKKEDLDLPDWCRKSNPKLSCLCARVIQVKKVPYLDQDRVELPPHLYAFIQKH